MKLNKLLVSLALVATGSVMVACGSGSTGGNSNPVPSVTPLTPPDGAVIPAGSTTGVAVNLEAGIIAVPGQGGYTAIQLTADQTESLLLFMGLGSQVESFVFNPSANGNVVVYPRDIGPNGSVLLINPTTQNTQGKSLKSSGATILEYALSNYTGLAPITPVGTSVGSSATVDGIMYGSLDPLTSVQGVTLSVPSAHINIPLNNCAGATGDVISAVAYKFNGVDYVGYGTDTGSVCVAYGGSISQDNLSAQAPTTNANAYLPAPVTNLGFPTQASTTSNLVGYWTNEKGIFKVFGKYNANNEPTGTGFLNVTSTEPQKQNGTAQTTTFSGNIPTVTNINSTYTDPNGNLWVGVKTGGQVYVLRNGQTAWQVQQIKYLTGQVYTGSVTVQSDGANQGGVAVTNAGTFDIE